MPDREPSEALYTPNLRQTLHGRISSGSLPLHPSGVDLLKRRTAE